MLLKKVNLPNIQSAGFADNALRIKLSSGEVLEFYGVTEDVFDSFLSSDNAENSISHLKQHYRWKSLGVLLG